MVRRAAPIPAIILFLWACGSPRPVPSLPEVRVDGFIPAVRALVQQALEEARRNPNDAAASGKLGMVLHAHEQFGAARICYLRAQALDPKSFAWPYYLSSVESGLGNHDAALAALGAALKIDPNYQAARLRRAEILFDQGKLDDSASLYEQIARSNPESATAWYGLGRSQSGKGETEKAAASLAKACELFPQYGQAHYALAQALRKLGKQEEAARHLAAYERYKIYVPNTGDTVMAEVLRMNISATNYMRLAADLDAQGRTKEALELHLRAIETDPNSAQAHANLITLYARLGDPEKAVEHYRKAVAISPNLADAHYNYGVMLFKENKPREAKAAFERAIEANRYFAEAHNNLGYLLEMEGRPAQAEPHYRAAIENLPAYRLAHFHLGRLLIGRRNYSEAIAHLEKTIAPEDDDTPGYLYALGAAYVRSGNRSRGVDLMRQAREKAAARSQTQLIASIDRDLAALQR